MRGVKEGFADTFARQYQWTHSSIDVSKFSSSAGFSSLSFFQRGVFLHRPTVPANGDAPRA
jgi:hypothetical protein